jgi:hypothetical protein
MIPAIRVSTSRKVRMLSAPITVRSRISPIRRISMINTVGPTSEATASSSRRSRLSSVDDTAAGRVSSAIDGCSAASPAAA